VIVEQHETSAKSTIKCSADPGPPNLTFEANILINSSHQGLSSHSLKNLYKSGSIVNNNMMHGSTGNGQPTPLQLEIMQKMLPGAIINCNQPVSCPHLEINGQQQAIPNSLGAAFADTPSHLSRTNITARGRGQGAHGGSKEDRKKRKSVARAGRQIVNTGSHNLGLEQNGQAAEANVEDAKELYWQWGVIGSQSSHDYKTFQNQCFANLENLPPLIGGEIDFKNNRAGGFITRAHLQILDPSESIDDLLLPE
jgi:hypothetical protein